MARGAGGGRAADTGRAPLGEGEAQPTRCHPLARLAPTARAANGRQGPGRRAVGRERGPSPAAPCPAHIAGDAEQPREAAKAVARAQGLSRRDADELVLAENKAALREMQRGRARARRMGTPATIGASEGVQREMLRRLPPGSELDRKPGKQPAEEAERAAVHRLAKRLRRAREATEASVAEALRAASVAVGMHLRALAVASLEELCAFVETAQHPLYRLEVACVTVNTRLVPRRRRQKHQRRVHFADEVVRGPVASAEPPRPAAEPARAEVRVEGELEGEPRVRVAAATAGILRGRVAERGAVPAPTTGGSRSGSPALLRTAAAAATAQRERKQAQAEALASGSASSGSDDGSTATEGGSPRQRRRRIAGRVRRKLQLFVGSGSGDGEGGTQSSSVPRLATTVASAMKQRVPGASGGEIGAGAHESRAQGAETGRGEEGGENAFEEEEEEEEETILSSLAAKVSSPRRLGADGERNKASPRVERRRSPPPPPGREASASPTEPAEGDSIPAGSAVAAATSLRSGSLPRAASFRNLGAAARTVLGEVQRRGKAPAAAFFTVSPRFREVIRVLCSVAEGARDCVAGLRTVEPDCARVSVDDVLNFTADPGACCSVPPLPHNPVGTQRGKDGTGDLTRRWRGGGVQRVQRTGSPTPEQRTSCAWAQR